MTQDSRAAFEEFYNKHYDNLDSEFAANMQNSWQASEQRILELLGSDEMVGFVDAEIRKDSDSYYDGSYRTDAELHSIRRAALQAISKRLGE